MTSTGLTTVGRGAYGLTLLLVPGWVVSLAGDSAPDGSACRVVRILGARHLAQAFVTVWSQTSAWAAGPGVSGRRLIIAGAGIDGLHAASMLVLAWAHPQLRRAELADAAVAAALAVTGSAEARS